MMKRLFTERHGEGRARVAESLDDGTREGLLTLVSARIDEEWFGCHSTRSAVTVTRMRGPT